MCTSYIYGGASIMLRSHLHHSRTISSRSKNKKMPRYYKYLLYRSTPMLSVITYISRGKMKLNVNYFCLSWSLKMFRSTVASCERSTFDLRTRRSPAIISICYIDQHHCSPCSHISQAKKQN